MDELETELSDFCRFHKRTGPRPPTHRLLLLDGEALPAALLSLLGLLVLLELVGDGGLKSELGGLIGRGSEVKPLPLLLRDRLGMSSVSSTGTAAGRKEPDERSFLPPLVEADFFALRGRGEDLLRSGEESEMIVVVEVMERPGVELDRPIVSLDRLSLSRRGPFCASAEKDLPSRRRSGFNMCFRS